MYCIYSILLFVFLPLASSVVTVIVFQLESSFCTPPPSSLVSRSSPILPSSMGAFLATNTFWGLRLMLSLSTLVLSSLTLIFFLFVVFETVFMFFMLLGWREAIPLTDSCFTGDMSIWWLTIGNWISADLFFRFLFRSFFLSTTMAYMLSLSMSTESRLGLVSEL